MIKFFLFILFCNLLGFLYSQDTLILTNGRYISGIKFQQEQWDLVHFKRDNSDKLQQISKDKLYAVFAMDRRIIYNYVVDDKEQPLSDSQMFNYLDGLVYARKNYSASFGFWSGLVVGLGASRISPVGVSAIPAIVYPGTYTFLSGYSTKKLPLDRRSDYYFKSGYFEGVRTKKLRSTAMGSLSGYVIGMLFHIYIF